MCLDKYFFFFSTKTCCGYSLEAPRRGASNESPQHILSWRKKKTQFFLVQKKSILPGAKALLSLDTALIMLFCFCRIELERKVANSINTQEYNVQAEPIPNFDLKCKAAKLYFLGKV